MKIIARIYTDFSSKFGIPRQSGIAGSAAGRIVFEPGFRDMSYLKGLEGFSHIWLIWEFSESERDRVSAMVKPPKLGGRTRVGVWASRAPYRPNPIGLSSVRLTGIYEEEEGPVIYVSGVDMLSGSPIYDIKPYLPYADCHADAEEGFSGITKHSGITVDFPKELLNRLPEDKREAAKEVLQADPRPAYDMYEDRIYGMEFAGFDIRFTADENVLRVREVIALHE